MTALYNRQRLWIFAVAILVGIGGILYGYDIGVISGALFFIRQSIPMTDTQIGMIVGAVLGGGLIGTLIGGPLADRFGRKIMLIIASLVFIFGVGCILITNSFLDLLLSRFLLGIGVGIIAVAVPLYVAELVPADDRGKYVTFFQLFLTLGILLAFFVDLAFTPSGNWRAMFAVVLLPALILLLGAFRLPESPRWLVANGKPEKARLVLRRMRTKEQAESALIRIYESLQDTQGTWRELFSKQNILPVFIAISISILNQWTGINVFLQYAPIILQKAGINSNFAAMLGSVGIGLLNLLCTLLAIFLVDRVGRRPLLLIGVMGVFVATIFLGFVNYLTLSITLEGVLSLIGLFIFIVFFAIGPGIIVWLVISELFPTRVRGKGIAICLFMNSFAGMILATIFLEIVALINVSGMYWLCAGFSLIYWLLSYFLLPETKAKSLEDIQHYFQQRQY